MADDSTGRPRVVRILNILSPYRVAMWRAVDAMSGVRSETWLMSRGERNRRWGLEGGEALNVRVFPDWGIDLSHRDMLIVHFNPGLLRALLRDPPDLVIVGGYESATCVLAALLLRRRGIPFLLTSEHADIDPPSGGLASRAVRRVWSAVVRSADGVLVSGSAARDHVLSLGARTDRIFVCPNAAEADRFAPAGSEDERRRLRDSLGLPSGTLCLFVGGLSRRKGVDELLEAFRRVAARRDGVHLVVVGEGPLMRSLRTAIDSDGGLRGRVRLMGYQPDERLPQIFAACDLFVFPTRYEVWGIVLNEAMGAGLAVITSDRAAGARDLIVPGVHGLIVRSGDVDGLAAAVESLVSDERLRRRMGDLARGRILAGFTPQHQAEAIVRAIRATIESRRRASPA